MTTMWEVDIGIARARLRLAKNHLAERARAVDDLVVNTVPCPLCNSPIGKKCRKPSGGSRPPHAERHRAA